MNNWGLTWRLGHGKESRKTKLGSCGTVAFIVLASLATVAVAGGLPGLKHSLVGDYDPLERLRPMPVDGPWLAGRFAAVCGPGLVVPKLDTPLSVAYKEHPFSAIDDAVVAARRANLAIPELAVARLAAEAGLTKEIPSLLETAVRRAPDAPEAYILLADIAIREGRYTEAEQVYIKADDLRGKLAKDQSRDLRLRKAILSGRARVAEARENYPQSQSYLEELRRCDSRDCAGVQQLIRVLVLQRKAKEALVASREAYRIDPARAPIPEMVIARSHGCYSEAKRWVDYAAKKHPNDARAQLVAGEWYLGCSRIADARQCAERALQLAPKMPEAILLRGITALYEGDPATAEHHCRAALGLSSQGDMASDYLALALIMQNDPAKWKEALGYAEKNTTSYPQDEEAADTLAAVLYRLGRLNDAEKILKAFVGSKALGAQQISGDTAYYLARIAYDRGNKADAKALLDALSHCLPISPLTDKAAKVLQERLEKELK
jgi:tetratricopeptide (TPR) repeat protein